LSQVRLFKDARATRILHDMAARSSVAALAQEQLRARRE
jgi:hypothetical protein